MNLNKRNSLIAWLLFGLILATNLAAIAFYITRPVGQRTPLFQLSFPLVPIFFALVGALILSRHPRNTIGWVMLLPGLSMAFFIEVLAPFTNGQLPPPANPSSLDLILLWFSSWNWLLLVLPIMFMMILFPTGQPLTPRWKWLVYFGQAIAALLIVPITFSQMLAPNVEPSPWSVPNPIGFLKPEWIDRAAGPFLVLFPIWIILCAIALFVRFRRAGGVERQQLKWLFYAGAIFVLFYMPSYIGNTYAAPNYFWNLLLPLGMSAFPIAIAIAILRHQLYDIDIIIRRTLSYGLLTALLALIYFGGVVLLQGVFGSLAGGPESSLIIVLSTLTIAALFNPLRLRTQAFIDRRFFRQKYDTEHTLAAFAAAARDEVDPDRLTEALLGAVEETVQPKGASLWLQSIKGTVLETANSSKKDSIR